MEEIEALHKEFRFCISNYSTNVQLATKVLERRLLKLAKNGKSEEVKSFVNNHKDIFHVRHSIHGKLKEIN